MFSKKILLRLLNSETIIHAQGAADWCGKRINCPIIRDPTTKRENEDGTWSYTQVERRVPRSKWRSTYVARDKISSKIPVYLTEGHYDDHGEELMEYVRNGGGLIGNDYRFILYR